MCYNNMCARLMPTIGQIAISKMGHDTNRLYVCVGVLNDEFCLVCDGRLRTLQKPKQKRYRHLRILCESSILAEGITSKTISDELIKTTLNNFTADTIRKKK